MLQQPFAATSLPLQERQIGGTSTAGFVQMSGFQISRRLFESPHPATYFLLTANIVIYGLSVSQSGLTDIPGAMLFRNGAMYTQALERHRYWRLVAAGFLHVNLIHLATNMLCLALWGGHLEKRIGAAYFVLVYLCALVAGALVSNVVHTTPYLSVGASGAISGLLGALLCLRLRLLGKIDLPLSFFAVNIGFNVVLAVTARNLDWGAHLGGFAAGMVACALLDAVERGNAYVLRCKFPEFAKMNLLLLAAGSLLLVWSMTDGTGWIAIIACCAAGVAVVKLTDIVLSLRRGLAIVVIGFAIANAALVGFALAARAPAGCRLLLPAANARMRDVVVAACGHLAVTIAVATAATLLLTLLLYSPELTRGLKDLGFVAAAMTGERKRRFGI